MRFSIHLLILILFLSCNQTSEKQQENSSDDLDPQEIQNGETAEALENKEENISNRSNVGEEFETLDVKKFNTFLASERPFSKPEIMLLFYPGEIEPPKDDEEVDVAEEILENGNTLVTLIHYNLQNDSIMGYKYLMEMKKINDKWMMASAKRNWKYYDGKEHTNWGIQKKPSSKITENNAEQRAQEDDNFKFLTIGFFNRHLDSTTEELTAKEVMRLFLPREEESNEGNQTETIREEKLPNGNTLVTLVRDNLMDDSMKAEQYLMELEKTDGKWHVVYVKTNWKCRKGRGHTDWGAELCL